MCPGASQSGSALLVTVLVLLVVSILGTTVVSLGHVDYTLSSNYRSSVQALNLADSGLQAAAADLRADYYADPANNWLVDWLNLGSVPPLLRIPSPDPAATLINGLTLTPASLGPNPYVGVPYDLGGPQTLGDGTYSRTIWLPPVVTMQGGKPVVNIRVRSVGIDGSRATPANAVIDGVVTIDVTDSSPYSAGAFLGGGDNGDLIRGGPVHIAGSVVVVGDASWRQRRRRGFWSLPSLTRLDLSNGSSIANNYAGIERSSALGTLAGKLPDLDSVDFNGETIETINAALHVKDALVEIGRNGALGEADSAGDGYKETLDAVYTDDPLMGVRRNVYADSIGPSDLGDDLAFPSLSDPYTDPATGSPYRSFADYLNSQAYRPVTGGDVVISSDTASFSWTDPAGKGSLAWDARTEILTVDGLVKINGRLLLGDPDARGGDRLTAVQYDGTGAIWATDDIEITKDLYPVGSYLADGPDADALVDGNLGLITSDEIIIDAGSSRTAPPGWSRGQRRGRRTPAGRPDDNIQILATLFAERRVDARVRANIAGAVVTNAFRVDSAAELNIWHVPTLGGSSPAGMPIGMMIADIQVAITEWYQRR